MFDATHSYRHLLDNVCSDPAFSEDGNCAMDYRAPSALIRTALLLRHLPRTLSNFVAMTGTHPNEVKAAAGDVLMHGRRVLIGCINRAILFSPAFDAPPTVASCH